MMAMKMRMMMMTTMTMAGTTTMPEAVASRRCSRLLHNGSCSGRFPNRKRLVAPGMKEICMSSIKGGTGSWPDNGIDNPN